MRESPGGLSQIKAYMKCPRFWALKYLLGWTLPSKSPSDALVLGSALHEAIAVYLNTQSVRDARRVLYANVRTDVNTSQTVGKDKEERHNLLRHRAKRCFDGWLKEWDTIFDDWEILSVEEEFRYRLRNKYEATLRTDRVIGSKKTGNIFIPDTKFTGWSLDGTEKNYMYNPQPLLYHTVPFYIRPKWGERFKGWLTDIVYQRGKAVAKTKVSQPVLYSRSEVEDYVASLATVVDDITYAIELSGKYDGEINAFFPANRGDACTVFNTVCPYIHTCLRQHKVGDKPELPFIKDDPEFLVEVHKIYAEVEV